MGHGSNGDMYSREGRSFSLPGLSGVIVILFGVASGGKIDPGARIIAVNVWKNGLIGPNPSLETGIPQPNGIEVGFARYIKPTLVSVINPT